VAGDFSFSGGYFLEPENLRNGSNLLPESDRIHISKK
jgi:hypothetical protein